MAEQYLGRKWETAKNIEHPTSNTEHRILNGAHLVMRATGRKGTSALPTDAPHPKEWCGDGDGYGMMGHSRRQLNSPIVFRKPNLNP
jgi:hypothetical protein